VSSARVPAEPPEVKRRFDTARSEWFSAAPESEGLPYYLTILRSNIWFIVITVLACLGAAILFLAQAQKVYESEADLLITPVPRENATLIGLGLPRESSDPTRDVETIARLIKTPAVARRVVERLRLDDTARELLTRIDATPVAQSNVVTIAARANDPELAAQIANAFANASVTYRTEKLHEQLDSAIPNLRRQLNGLGSNEQAARDALVERLSDLEALRVLNDPTLRVETPAEASGAPISPRPVLTIAAALVAGLILGIAAALASQLLDPRLRREEQLRRYRVPILARVPQERNARKREKASPLLPASVSLATHDAYLLLGATLSIDDGGQGGGKRSVLVTGPSSGDGKTTTALNLATALAEMERVVLVEGDSRRPTLARTFGVQPKHGLSLVVARRIPLDEVLVTLDGSATRFQVLLQKPGDAPLSAAMTPASAEWLIRQAHLRASWLVVDAPPLAMVPDALPIAKQVDDVILVVRLGNTRLKALEELAELLVQQGITPAGFVVVGGKSQTTYYAG
jgi:Mrp family chromosome partitioning ATPase